MSRAVGSLSLIAGLRFFGLFVVMPTLALYTDGNYSALNGVAIGVYAISQIIFQVPFGILGERYSKRAVIAFGLIIFVLGSLICYLADNIYLIILGRIIQGAGAIGSVITAKITDLVPEEKRGKAMVVMGLSIFASFVLAMIIGPNVGAKYGLHTLFLITAILSTLAIVLLFALVPPSPSLRGSVENSDYRAILKNKNLAILNISIALQKFLFVFGITIIPLVLTRFFEMQEIWKVFSIASVCGIFALAPGMIISEKYKRPKPVLLAAVVVFALAFLFMAFGREHDLFLLFCAGVILFFCAFCVHEPILQNLASKYPKIHEKSLSLGIFTTCGFIGSFLGGFIGGITFARADLFWAFIIVVCAIIAWFVLLMFLKNPARQENLYIRIDKNIDTAEINAISGVIESYINKSEKILVVKFDSKIIQKDEISAKLARFLKHD